jgi:hypothetical protein
MGSAPDIPPPPPPPAPPPPPTATAQRVEKATKRRPQASKKRGVSALTVRRSTVNTGTQGIGANVPY